MNTANLKALRAVLNLSRDAVAKARAAESAADRDRLLRTAIDSLVNIDDTLHAHITGSERIESAIAAVDAALNKTRAA